jgi:HlyD family secretion protein
MMRKLAWVVAGVVLAGAGFAVVSTAGAEPGGRYRVASVTVGDVAQTVSVSGTVDRVNRADVSFGTSGSLAALSAGVGDSVSAGQELGSLDTTSLQAAVDKAQSDVDQSESNLTTASDAVEEATSPSSSAADPQASADPGTGKLVQAVKDAQSAASAALKSASDAMAAQEAACADPTEEACAAAGAATLKAQQAVKSAQDTLQGKLDALSSALSTAASSQSSSQSNSQSSSQSNSSESSGSSDSRSGPSASATSVAEAQAAVDQAKVKLVEAQQALAGATLKSPISGTVASVSAAVGDQVSTGTAVVVVVGEGAADVTATVTVEQLTKLKSGQAATVTPVGTSQKVTGTVTRVSTTPDPNAESVAYPVTITVDQPPVTMAAGSSATASVVVATAKNVLTVPTSAVTRNTVTVLNGDQPSLTPVTVGAVGPTRTEIKEGVSRGQEVVLADLDSPLPTTDSSTQGNFLRGGPEGGRGEQAGPVVRRGSGN